MELATGRIHAAAFWTAIFRGTAPERSERQESSKSGYTEHDRRLLPREIWRRSIHVGGWLIFEVSWVVLKPNRHSAHQPRELGSISLKFVRRSPRGVRHVAHHFCAFDHLLV
jgi:hypothetical protein